MFDNNDFDKMLKGMNRDELEVVNTLMDKMLDLSLMRVLSEKPDSIEARKAFLCTRLMKLDIAKAGLLLSRCPEDEFVKHETNLKLVLETVTKELEDLEEKVGGARLE